MAAKWIVVSGLDGSGKTTLVKDLANYLEQNGKRVKTAHLPFDEHIVKDLLNVSTNSYTDRILFACDNRIFAEHLRKWIASNEYDYIITQRGFFDSFVHGAVQGYSYPFIAGLNQINDLPKCDAMIHLVASYKTAFERIKGDPDADKFEYLEYMQRQEIETRRGYEELKNMNPDLEAFFNAKNVYVDTTDFTTAQTFNLVLKRMEEIGIIP